MTAIEFSQYINRTVWLQNVQIGAVKTVLLRMLDELGFGVLESADIDNGFLLKARRGPHDQSPLGPFGSLYPHAHHDLEAQITPHQEGAAVTIQIKPHLKPFAYLGVYRMNPWFWLGKFDDNYTAAVLMHTIGWGLHAELGLDIPEEFREFNHKRVTSENLWDSLLYPFDLHSSTREVHFPCQPGPAWSWGAFTMPGLWFLLHNIDGAGYAALFFELVGLTLLIVLPILFGFPWIVVGLVILTVGRVFASRIGHRLYYARHGHWKR